MAAAKTTGTTPFDGDVEANVERVRALNEKLLAAAKQSGAVSLDAYEKTLGGMVDLEQRLAGAAQLDWVNELAGAHTTFVSEVSGAYTKAAREALK